MAATTHPSEAREAQPQRLSRLVLFLIVQFAQVAAGGLALFTAALIAQANPIEAFMMASFIGVGYFAVAVITGYPLAAAAVTLLHRKPWAAALHLGVTLFAGLAFATDWFTSSRLLATPLIAPLIAGPLAGFLVFRALTRHDAHPSPSGEGGSPHSGETAGA